MDVKTAATAASKAFPPDSNIVAAAAKVVGSPAAMVAWCFIARETNRPLMTNQVFEWLGYGEVRIDRMAEGWMSDRGLIR
jgi:hypothetical protein